MSCSTLNTQAIQLDVSVASLPEGFCPSSMQELANAIGARIIISPSATFNTFAIGSTAPASNVGPWLKDCAAWFVFDDATATYIPTTKEGFNNQQMFTSSGEFIVPDFIYKLKVSLWGAGGGGANAAGTAGAGGGGGSYGQTIFTVTPGQIIPVTVGTGGANGTPGGTGGSSTFLTMTAAGGAGGVGVAGGNGGTSTGGTVLFPGGAAGSVISGAGHPVGDAGNGAMGGQGGVFELTGFTKINGKFPGGGGAPSDATVNSGSAGSGANGAALVEW